MALMTFRPWAIRIVNETVVEIVPSANNANAAESWGVLSYLLNGRARSSEYCCRLCLSCSAEC